MNKTKHDNEKNIDKKITEFNAPTAESHQHSNQSTSLGENATKDIKNERHELDSKNSSHVNTKDSELNSETINPDQKNNSSGYDQEHIKPKRNQFFDDSEYDTLSSSSASGSYNTEYGQKAEGKDYKMFQSIVSEKEKEIEDLKQKNLIFGEKLRESYTDFEKAKARHQNESEKIKSNAKTEILVQLINEILDNFDRAGHAKASVQEMIDIINDPNQAQNSKPKIQDLCHLVLQFLSGINIIERKFSAFLTKNNVGKIEVKIGDEFDSNYHDAISSVEKPEYDENSIVDVVSQGYKLGDKVIKHAQVIVASND